MPLHRIVTFVFGGRIDGGQWSSRLWLVDESTKGRGRMGVGSENGSLLMYVLCGKIPMSVTAK